MICLWYSGIQKINFRATRYCGPLFTLIYYVGQKLTSIQEQLRELGEAVSDGENDDEGDDDKDEQLQQPE
jgi:hypothetical protein